MQQETAGNEWYGFREGKYNWCLYVFEHWVDSEERKTHTPSSCILDGTQECFMRVYLTRTNDYWHATEHLVRYLRTNFPRTENWYEIKIYRGNNRVLFAKIAVKPEISEDDDWEEVLLNAEHKQSVH